MAHVDGLPGRAKDVTDRVLAAERERDEVRAKISAMRSELTDMEREHEAMAPGEIKAARWHRLEVMRSVVDRFESGEHRA